MDLQATFASLKKAYAYSKEIEIDELGLVITLEPPTNVEEQAVLDACSDLEGGDYLEGIRNHSLAYAIKVMNGERIPDIIQGTDENGEPVEKTRYLFMVDQVESWSSPLRDHIYEAYQSLLAEIQDKANKTIKFERFELSNVEVTPPAPDEFTKIEEPEDHWNLSPEELLEKQIRKEQDEVAAGMAQTEAEAVDKELK